MLAVGPLSIHHNLAALLLHMDFLHAVEGVDDGLDAAGAVGHEVNLIVEQGGVAELHRQVEVAADGAHDILQLYIVEVEESVAPRGVGLDVYLCDAQSALVVDGCLLAGVQFCMMLTAVHHHAARDQCHIVGGIAIGPHTSGRVQGSYHQYPCLFYNYGDGY